MQSIRMQFGLAVSTVLMMTCGFATTAEAATITRAERVNRFADGVGFNERPDPFTISFTNLPTSGTNGILRIAAFGDFDDPNEWVRVILDPQGTRFNLRRFLNSNPKNDKWRNNQKNSAGDVGNQYVEVARGRALLPDDTLNQLLSDGQIDARVAFGPGVGNSLDPNFRQEFIRLQLEYDEVPTGNAIPTPALLPGLVGMGAAALRKHRFASTTEA